MPNESTNQEILLRFESAMGDFHEAMRLRDELSVRIGSRTTQIIRFSLFLMTLVSLLLFYLIWSLSQDMHQMTGHMTTMSYNMQSMNQNVSLMNQQMIHMNQNMNAMNQSFYQVTRDTHAMSSPIRMMPFMP